MPWITLAFVALLAATLVAMYMRTRTTGFGGGTAVGAGYAEGVLTITGASDRQPGDRNGQWFCTVSGTITGPETAPTEVYGKLVCGPSESAPRIGEDRPVVFKPGKTATSWRLVAPGE
ncbi:MAG: hypothetical protein QM658_05200 [Gordonia sp. (in: high G+C Gram-positive bacteria)]